MRPCGQPTRCLPHNTQPIYEKRRPRDTSGQAFHLHDLPHIAQIFPPSQTRGFWPYSVAELSFPSWRALSTSDMSRARQLFQYHDPCNPWARCGPLACTAHAAQATYVKAGIPLIHLIRLCTLLPALPSAPSSALPPVPPSASSLASSSAPSAKPGSEHESEPEVKPER